MNEKLSDSFPSGSTSPLGQFDKETERITRRAAGLPEYDMDDPERPFTEEYDDQPVVEVPVSDEVKQIDVGDGGAADSETVDTTPSADARDIYRQPSPKTLRSIRRNRILGEIASTRHKLEAIGKADSTEDQHGASQ